MPVSVRQPRKYLDHTIKVFSFNMFNIYAMLNEKLPSKPVIQKCICDCDTIIVVDITHTVD